MTVTVDRGNRYNRAMDAHDPYEALRHISFRLFAASYSLAVIGSNVLSSTVQWDIYQRTKDPFAIGMVGLTNALPVILFALPAGHVADQFSRKRVLLMTQIPLAMVPAALAGLHLWYPGAVSTSVTLLLLAINAIALTFARPARSSILPNLIPRSAFPNGFAWMSSLFETASWVGPAIAGGLLVLGVAWSYAFAACCLLGCLIITLFLPATPVVHQHQESGTRLLLAGLRFVLNSPLVMAAMTLDMLAVLLGGATYLLPVFADRLGVDSVGFGWMRASPALGAFGMAIIQAHRPPLTRAGPTLLIAVASFGLATIVFGMSQNYWLSLLMLFIIGASDNISVVIRQTLIQSVTPDSMRGRVAAVNQVFIGASNDLGGLESGLTARAFGPVISVVGGGIGTLVVVMSVAGIWPQIRRLGSLRALQTDEPVGEAE